MRNLRYPLKESIDGPWLLSSKSLKELDKIIMEYWGKFESRREKLLRRFVNDYKKKTFTQADKDLGEVSEQHHKKIQAQIREAKQNSLWSRSEQSLEIALRDKTVCSYKNFEEAFRDRYLLDKRPKGFTVTLVSGDIKFEMTLDSYGIHFRTKQFEMALDSEGTHYEINAKSDLPIQDVPEVQELYTAVYEWAMEIRRHARAGGIWGKIAKHSGKILIAGIGLPVLVFLVNRFFGPNQTQDQLYRLYEQGITNSNVIDAVNLLVLLRKSEHTTITSFQISPWLRTYTAILVYLVIALFVSPKAELAIGKGRDAIQFWGWWQWAVALPVVLFVGDILRPRAVELFNNLLLHLR
jgi:hypothetical protein